MRFRHRRAADSDVCLDLDADPRAGELWARIRRDQTAVSRLPWRSFAFANEVRDWAYAHTLVATELFLLDGGGDYSVYQEPASATLQRMERLEGGFWCGGTASFLRQVYRALGLRAFAVNFGDLETGDTHVFTLVAVLEGDQECLSVQDAHLNVALGRADGAPMDWREAATLAAASRAAEVAEIRGRAKRHRVLLGYPSPGRIGGGKTDGQGFAEAIAATSTSRTIVGDRALHETDLFTPEVFQDGDWFAATRSERLVRFGTASICSLLASPLSTSGESEAEDLVFGRSS